MNAFTIWVPEAVRITKGVESVGSFWKTKKTGGRGRGGWKNMPYGRTTAMRDRTLLRIQKPGLHKNALSNLSDDSKARSSGRCRPQKVKASALHLLRGVPANSVTEFVASPRWAPPLDGEYQSCNARPQHGAPGVSICIATAPAPLCGLAYDKRSRSEPSPEASLDAVLRPYLSRYDLPAIAAAIVIRGDIVAAGASVLGARAPPTPFQSRTASTLDLIPKP